MYSNYLASMGRHQEAADVAKQTIDLDPLARPYTQIGFILLRTSRYPEALEHFLLAIEAGETFGGHFGLAEYYLRNREFDEAAFHAAAAERALGDEGSPTWLALIAHHYARASQIEKAERILNELESRAEIEYVPPNALAVIYLGLGQEAKALELLERGFEERDVNLVWNKVRWIWDPLRDEPRFQKIIEKMNFPDG